MMTNRDATLLGLSEDAMNVALDGPGQGLHIRWSTAKTGEQPRGVPKFKSKVPKYRPHQGQRERERRMKRMEKG